MIDKPMLLSATSFVARPAIERQKQRYLCHFSLSGQLLLDNVPNFRTAHFEETSHISGGKVTEALPQALLVLSVILLERHS